MIRVCVIVEFLSAEKKTIPLPATSAFCLLSAFIRRPLSRLQFSLQADEAGSI